MSDLRKKLANLWNGSSRFGTFGNVLTKIAVRGVRCHSDTIIDLRSPITAFTGYNGTGKSTLLQLAAAAYISGSNFTINSFIRKGPLDQTVFADNATIQVEFQDQQGIRPLTLSYNPGTTRWQGYPRRPIRQVFFGGVGVFLPRSEQQDFVFRNASKLTLSNVVELPDELRQHIARILSCGYARIDSNTVTHKTQQDSVLSATRDGRAYSEAHMGCGEGRIQCLVKRLESLPENSLILLEEPEISLHPHAEYELGRYLMDLVSRKGHQVLLTTHSSLLLRSLPDASLVYLARDHNVIKPLPGIGSRHAASLLTEGHDKALTVLVEDIAAELTLNELIRHHSPEFLTTVRIAIAREQRDSGGVDASGKDAIRSTMKTLSEAGLKLAAVLDGGEVADPARFIYVLPGSTPPEEQLYHSASVRNMLHHNYGLDLGELDAELVGRDCHDYFEVIGRKASCDEGFLVREAAREYAKDVDVASVSRLIEQLKEAAGKK